MRDNKKKNRVENSKNQKGENIGSILKGLWAKQPFKINRKKKKGERLEGKSRKHSNDFWDQKNKPQGRKQKRRGD